MTRVWQHNLAVVRDRVHFSLSGQAGWRRPLGLPVSRGEQVATVNRFLIDRGLLPHRKAHGREGIVRGYHCFERKLCGPARADALTCLPVSVGFTHGYSWSTPSGCDAPWIARARTGGGVKGFVGAVQFAGAAISGRRKALTHRYAVPPLPQGEGVAALKVMIADVAQSATSAPPGGPPLRGLSNFRMAGIYL